MNNPDIDSIKNVSLQGILEGMEVSEESIRLRAERLDAEFLVRFENLNFDSSRFGETKLLFVGSGCTYKTVEELVGKHLGETPSVFMYPVSYARMK
jgi:hypothetical protein